MSHRSEGRPGRWLSRWWPWLLGLVGAALALGPALGPGSLLNLDLVLTPHLQIPPGVWGLGPALPQRIAAGLPQAFLSPLLGAPTAGKLMIVLAIAVAFVGMERFTRPAPVLIRVAAATLYALGPYSLTRMAVGHLNVQAVLAILPFALPVLLRPGERIARTYLWALALSCAGSPGGVTAFLVIAVGLVADRGKRAVPVLGALAVSCLVWLAPSASVLAAGAGVTDAGQFATQLHGFDRWGELLVGGGFWRGGDLGAHGWWVSLVGLALLGLAVFGHRDLPERIRGRLLAVALVGMGLTLASGVPGVRVVYEWFTALPIGAPFRESQRSSCLWLAWLVPAAAFGTARLTRGLRERGDREGSGALEGLATMVPVLGMVLVLLVCAPGWWGANGDLEPLQFPKGWAAVSKEVDAHPGTVLALPWKEYLDISFAGGRRVLNPVPDYFGGDVLSSYDPEFDLSKTSQEQVDHRADQVDRFLPRLLVGTPVSKQLRDLGVRWVVLLHESTVLPPGIPDVAAGRATWERYRAGLEADPGLTRRHLDRSIELWEVDGWRGPVRPASGGSAGISGPLPILRSTPAPAGTWNTGGAPGWMRGTTPATVEQDGLLGFDGSGALWFWPGFLVLAADGLVVVAACVAAWRLRQQP